MAHNIDSTLLCPKAKTDTPYGLSAKIPTAVPALPVIYVYKTVICRHVNVMLTTNVLPVIFYFVLGKIGKGTYT